MAKHIETGIRGEALAEDYLTTKGWRIVDLRWRDRAVGGLSTDVDIIAADTEGIYHFVEVKTRTGVFGACSTGDFSPAAAVTPAKIKRMAAAAERYLTLLELDVEISIDLITVTLYGGETPQPTISYYPDVSR